MKIKHVLATIILTVSAATVQAQTMSFCNKLYDTSEAVMDARQSGVDLRQMMQAAEGNQLHEDIVKLAYKQPKYSTESYQQNAIKQFAEQFYLSCLEQMDE